jgi:hypothetical protein
MAYGKKSKLCSTVGGLALFISLGIVASQIEIWFLLGVWNPISIATIFDLLVMAGGDFRPMESLIGLQNIIDGTSFFGLPASAAFAVIGLVFVANIRTTESAGDDRRRAKALPSVS